MYMEKARALREATDRHYNCAQSVLAPFAPAAGMTEAQALGCAANFGAGMRRGSVCGAVTGGLMALGALGVEDPAAAAEFQRRVKQAHEGCLDCADLLRINQREGGDKKAHCDGMVYECAALVEELARRAGKL